MNDFESFWKNQLQQNLRLKADTQYINLIFLEYIFSEKQAGCSTKR